MKSDLFPEPNNQIFKIFFYGILLCIPAFIINTALGTFFSNIGFDGTLLPTLLTAAPIEEILKFIVLYYLVYKMKDFNEPIDGIVYGVTVSLGFATLENIYYVYVLSDYYNVSSQSLAILRSFSTIPAHGIFGATMGYFFMKYSFIKKQDNLTLCIIVPILLHASYNFFVSTNFLIALLIIFISWFILLNAFSKLKNKQKKKKKEYEKKV